MIFFIYFAICFDVDIAAAKPLDSLIYLFEPEKDLFRIHKQQKNERNLIDKQHTHTHR